MRNMRIVAADKTLAEVQVGEALTRMRLPDQPWHNCMRESVCELVKLGLVFTPAAIILGRVTETWPPSAHYEAA